jgi:AcrR family transcriptional regulator
MPTSGPTRRATRRRDELLDALATLFLSEGFLEFGVGDLAARLSCSRSTLYVVAQSKEQIVLAGLRHFFRGAADRIEAKVEVEPDPGLKLSVYLRAVAQELEPASQLFYADLAAYMPGREIYAENTRYAAQRVRRLVDAGVEAGAMRPVDGGFVGTAVAAVMTAIQSGQFGEATGLADAAAYAALADLVMDGLRPEARSGRSTG